MQRKKNLIHKSALILSCAIFSMSTLTTSVAAEEKDFWIEDWSTHQKAPELEKPDTLTIEVATNLLVLLQNRVTFGIEIRKTLWRRNIWGTIPIYPIIEVHYVEIQYAKIEDVKTYGVVVGGKSNFSKSSSYFSDFWLGRNFGFFVSESKESRLADFAISTTLRIGYKWLIREKLVIEPRFNIGIIWGPFSYPYELNFCYPYGMNIGYQF